MTILDAEVLIAVLPFRVIHALELRLLYITTLDLLYVHLRLVRLGLRLHVASFVHTPPSGRKGRMTDEIRHTLNAMNWSCQLL